MRQVCVAHQLLVLVFAALAKAAVADLPDAQFTEDAAKALANAYPTYLEAAAEPGELRWTDGTAVDFRAPEQLRPHALMLADGTLWEQMLQAYPRGWPYAVPEVNQEPGRIRCEAFFKKIYGETERDVRHNLVQVPWPPSGPNGKISFSRVNGAAEALTRVGEELAELPGEVQAYVAQSAGTFNWRTIAGTDRLSMHSFGIAIDFKMPNPAASYWQWRYKDEDADIAYPKALLDDDALRQVVETFERHGIIWGGKWHHYDPMHFEYRPELLNQDKVASE